MTDNDQEQKKQRIIRSMPETEYFSIPNAVCQNVDLPYDSLGVLVYLLSQSLSWSTTVFDLRKRGDGKTKIYRILNDLEKAGYMSKPTKYQDKKTGQWVWTARLVADTPIFPIDQDPCPTYPDTGKWEIKEESTDKKKDISPSGETDEKTLSVEEADNNLFGTREDPVIPDPELLKPTFTTNQLKQLATAYVTDFCYVGEHNRVYCLELNLSGYFKVRGRNAWGVTSYKLSATGKAVCSDPSTTLLDIIKQKQETQATIVARKEAAKGKPKKKKNGSKTPVDLSTRPEIEPIVQALCQIHFNSTYQDATDANKQTLISLASIYRNQGADTAAKVHQVHNEYKNKDWYAEASPFGFTQKMRIMQALSNNSKNQPADKISKFSE